MVRLTDRPDMTLDVYSGRKTTMQQSVQMARCSGWSVLYYVIKYMYNDSIIFLGEKQFYIIAINIIA